MVEGGVEDAESLGCGGRGAGRQQIGQKKDEVDRQGNEPEPSQFGAVMGLTQVEQNCDQQ